MKILARPIDVIASCRAGSAPLPRRFRMKDADGSVVEIRVDHITNIEKRRIAGIDTINYTCESDIHGVCRVYELKYTVSKYSWELYKM
ncbi:MAG: hypothetical protein ACI4LM_03050 [Anaerovoracaceae bacterium]|jgi:hypothetical protein